jgi:hypothetical protein
MKGRVLDTGEIERLRTAGWNNREIADHFNLPVGSVARSSFYKTNPEWDADPSLRERWERRMPTMRAAIREVVLREKT